MPNEILELPINTQEQVTDHETSDLGHAGLIEAVETDPARQIHEEFPSVSPRQPNIRVGKIHWESSEHQQALIERQKRTENVTSGAGEQIFGPKTLGYIEAARNDYDSPSNIEKKVKQELEGAKERLFLYLSPEAEADGIYSAFRASRIIEETRELGAQPSLDESVVEQAKQILKSMTDKEFEDFLVSHVEKEKERQQHLESEIESQKTQFTQQLRQAVEKGDLPPNVDPELVEKRLSELEIILIDPLSAAGPGFYNAENHAVLLIATDDLREVVSVAILQEADGQPVTLQHVFAHEALHGEGGKTVVQQADPALPTVARSGLEFLKRETGEYTTEEGETEKFSFYTYRFAWLTEAVTEISTMKVTKEEKSPARAVERHLLELLRTKGNQEIPEKLFLNAYFEDYDLSKPYGDRIPAWKELRRSLNEAYDSSFFIELDNMVAAYEDEAKAVAYLESLVPGQYDIEQGIKAFRQSEAAKFGLASNASWEDIAKAEIAKAENL